MTAEDEMRASQAFDDAEDAAEEERRKPVEGPVQGWVVVHAGDMRETVSDLVVQGRRIELIILMGNRYEYGILYDRTRVAE